MFQTSSPLASLTAYLTGNKELKYFICIIGLMLMAAFLLCRPLGTQSRAATATMPGTTNAKKMFKSMGRKSAEARQLAKDQAQQELEDEHEAKSGQEQPPPMGEVTGASAQWQPSQHDSEPPSGEVTDEEHMDIALNKVLPTPTAPDAVPCGGRELVTGAAEELGPAKVEGAGPSKRKVSRPELFPPFKRRPLLDEDAAKRTSERQREEKEKEEQARISNELCEFCLVVSQCFLSFY